MSVRKRHLLPTALFTVLVMPAVVHGAETGASAGAPVTYSVFGGVEFLADTGRDHVDTRSNDIVKDRSEVGLHLHAHQHNARLHLLGAEEYGDSDAWFVEEAFIEVTGFTGSATDVAAGLKYLPIHDLDSAFISDAVTTELAETRDDSVSVRWAGVPIHGDVFVARNNRGSRSHVENGTLWGINVGSAFEINNGTMDVEVGWLNDLGHSDLVSETLPAAGSVDNVPAISARLTAQWSRTRVSALVVAATEAFRAAELAWRTSGAQPLAWGVELGRDVPLLTDYDAAISFGVQGSGEALALGLPRTRWLAGIAVPLSDYVTAELELAHAVDYSLSDGGTGEHGTTATLRIAVGF